MSNNTPTNTTTNKVDELETPIIVPTNKLDAEEYSADDLDGVTESVFGSGNMAYASLQASQTDAALDANNAYNNFDNGITGTNTDRPITENTGNNISSPGEGNFSSTLGSVGTSQLSSDEGTFAGEGSGLRLEESINFDNEPVNNTQNNARSENANSSNSSNSQGTSQQSDQSVTENNTTIAGDVFEGDEFTETINEITLNLGDQITEISQQLIDINEVLVAIENLDITNLTDVTQEVTNIVEDITNFATETINIDIVTEKVTALNTVIQKFTTKLETVIEQVTDIDLSFVQEITNQVENLNTLINNVVEFVEIKIGNKLDYLIGGNESGEGDVGIDLDLDLVDSQAVDALEEGVEQTVETIQDTLDSVGVDLDIEGIVDELPVVETVTQAAAPVIDVAEDLLDTTSETVESLTESIPDNIIINPVEDLIGDVDTQVNIAEDLLGLDGNETDNDAGDTDITAQTDIDLIDNTLANADLDVAIDPVENITGDIDVDLTAATDLLGETADPLVNPDPGGSSGDSLLGDTGGFLSETVETVTEPLIGDTNANAVSDIDLLNTQTPSEDQTDIDLTIGAEVLDTEIIPETNVEGNLDIIENLTGDIDLEIDTAIDLLNTSEANALTNSTDEILDTNWTESTITGSGGLFDDLVNEANIGGDMLPDPSGTVAEGIGALNVEPETDVSSTGGLFG